MMNDFNIGAITASSRQFIPKHSPCFKAWKMGKIKPKNYWDRTWFWKVEIEYLKAGEMCKFVQLYDYSKREYAVNTRDLVLTNLMIDELLEDITVLRHSIHLVMFNRL